MIKFRTKIDFWVYLTLLAFIAGIVYCFHNIFSSGNSDIANALIPILILFAGVTIILAMCFCTYYIFEDETLYVKTLFSKTRIPYKDIVSIKSFVNIWSAPVLSVFRIIINYGRGGEVLITPRKQKQFLELLHKKIKQSGNINFLYENAKRGDA